MKLFFSFFSKYFRFCLAILFILFIAMLYNRYISTKNSGKSDQDLSDLQYSSKTDLSEPNEPNYNKPAETAIAQKINPENIADITPEVSKDPNQKTPADQSHHQDANAPARKISREEYARKVAYYRQQLASVLTAFGNEMSPERRMELLSSLRSPSLRNDPRMIKLAKQGLEDANDGVKRAAAELLADSESPDVIPIASIALASNDEQVRLAGVNALTNVDHPDAGKLLGRALNDPSELVRQAAIDTVKFQSENIAIEAMQNVMTSPYNYVKQQAVEMLEFVQNYQAVEILFEGLKDSTPEFQKQVNDALGNLLNKDLNFKNYQEALAWWNVNRTKYDDKLFEVEGSQPGENLN